MSVTDENIESAIVRAVLDGRAELAEELRSMLRRRRHERAGNVAELAKRG